MRLKGVLAFLLLPSAAWAQSETIGNGADVLYQAGIQEILSPAGLEIQSGGSLTATYKVYNAPGEETKITSGVAGGVPVTILSGGAIDARNLRFQNITTLTAASGAKIIRLFDVAFEDLAGLSPGTAPWIDLSAMTATDRQNLTFSFNRVSFIDPQATPTRTNIKAGASTPLLRVLGNSSQGNRWGEAFNNDPANVVRWHTGIVTRTSPAGTFDTVEEALRDAGTVAGSTMTVNLGMTMIDDWANFLIMQGSGPTSAGPVIRNACLAPMPSKTAVWGFNGGGPLGKLSNCIVARGAATSFTAENCTFFGPASPIVLSSITGTNCLAQNGSGNGNVWTTSIPTATAAFFLNSTAFDFHLVSPGGDAAIDEGTTLTNASDLDGEARGFDGKAGGAGTWDIGADEFTVPVVTTLSQSTNDNTPLIQATATTGRVVVFFRNSTSIGSVTAAAGAASISDPTAQPDGVYTYTAAYDLGNGVIGPKFYPGALITIDTVAPTVTSVSSTTPNGSYGVGAVINVTVNFSEAVTLVGGNLRVTLNTGVVVSITPFGPSTSAGGTYTVVAGNNTPDLTATSPLTLSAGTLRDSAGNGATLTIPANQNLGNLKDIIIDTTAPTIANVTSTTANGSYGLGAVINVTVNFSEAVILASGNLQVTLSTGTVVTIAPFGPASSASGSYTVTVGQSSPDLNATTPLTLQAGATLRDPAGNTSSLSIPAGQNLADLKAIVVDGLVPTIVSVSSTTANGTYGIGAPINIQVTFSEAVTLAGGNLVVALSTNVNVSIAPFTAATTANGTYVVSQGENSPDLNATSPLTLSGGTLRDAAGNNVVLTIPAAHNIADLKAIVIKTPPLPPTNIRVTPYATAVDIEWDPSPSPANQLAGYNVYRRIPGNSWPATPLNRIAPLNGLVSNTKFRDTTAATNTTYEYQVTAVGP